MPKLFASFTATLRELKSGSITVKDLESGYFIFGCARSHALEPWKDATNELHWFWRDNPEEGLRVHGELANALIAAETDERVIWREEFGGVELHHKVLATISGLGAEVIR